MFCKKDALRRFTKFTGKHLCQSLFFNKVAGLLKKGLWYKCFPVNFVKFLRTSFFMEHLQWLLLLMVSITSGKQIARIYIVPNISKSLRNQTMKLSEFIEYNMKKMFFFEKSYVNYGRKINPRPFSK